MQATVLSIQSWVATGHVGNAAAMFPLQRMGAEVWGVHTVQFSNHPGHGGFAGQVFSGGATRALIDGIEARGVLPGCDAVLSGYMGDVGAGDAVLHAVGRVRAGNPRALYCCDPVIGDFGKGVFVRAGIPELLRDLAVPVADIVTPNQFELAYLTAGSTGGPCPTVAGARAAVGRLRARMAAGGRGIVLVTSLVTEATPAGMLDLMAGDRGGDWLLRVPLLPITPSGAGDLIAALFLLHVLRGGTVAEALGRAGSSVAGVLRRTAAAGAPELLLVQAQEEFVTPSTVYRAERL